MLLNRLTNNISTRTIVFLLIVTVFIDIVLYFTKYSYFLDTIYDMITFFSFYIGIELHNRLRDVTLIPLEETQKIKIAKYIKQFATVFLIFVIANTIVDMYSSSYLTSYWENFDDQVSTYDDQLNDFEASIEQATTGEEHLVNFFAKVDMVGYDFLTSILAGSEEIWRLGYIVLILLVIKKLFPRNWLPQNKKLFLGITVGITSILFGIGHTLAYDYNLSVWVGTVIIYSFLGIILCLLLLWTKNLWLLVTVHAFYDVVATLSWHYIPWAVWYVCGILVICRIIAAAILRE